MTLYKKQNNKKMPTLEELRKFKLGSYRYDIERIYKNGTSLDLLALVASNCKPIDIKIDKSINVRNIKCKFITVIHSIKSDEENLLKDSMESLEYFATNLPIQPMIKSSPECQVNCPMKG